jgi:DNA-binding NarL/FixJ family response regulator
LHSLTAWSKSSGTLAIAKRAIGIPLTGIARELSLSVKTVSTYRTRILEKMDFKTNADMIGYALRNGLIQ